MTALFFALIGMIYGRTHTRDIREMGGLMKIMPYLGVCYVIAGLASLGLPGLSGFVAEMTVFVGAFQETDTFHRVFTIIACTSIVITAVHPHSGGRETTLRERGQRASLCPHRCQLV